MAANPFDEFLEDDQQQGSEIDRFFERQDELRGLQLRKAVTDTADSSPDQEAQISKTARAMGMPLEVVRRNWKAIKRNYDIEAIPYERVLQSPALAEWGTAPEHMAVAKDDLENLGLLEWIVTAPGRSFAQSLAQMRMAELRTASLYRELTTEERDELSTQRYHAGLGGDLGVGESWFRGAVTGGSALLANILKGGSSAATYAALGAGVGAIIGGAGGAAGTAPIGGIGMVPGAKGGAVFGAKVGAAIGGAKFGFELEAGLALEEYLSSPEFKDEHGQQIDEDTARAAALAVGAINAGMEVGGLAVLLRSFPSLSALKGDATRKAVAQALKNPTIRAALFNLTKEYGKTLTAETATEMGQRAVTVMAGELAKQASGQDIEQLTTEQVLDDVLREGLGALQGFSLIAAPGPMLSFVNRADRARSAQTNRAMFTALGEGIGQSKTVERAPDAAMQFLQSAAEAGGNPTVYIPTEAWVSYWQSQNVDPAVMARELTGDPTALEDAQNRAADLAIPTSAYAVKLAATPHNGFFADEIRLTPDGMNYRESEAFKAEARAALEAAAAGAAEETAESPLVAQAREQLERAGYRPETAAALAKLLEMSSLAERVGPDIARQVLEPLGLNIQRTTAAEWQAAGRRPAGGTAPAAGPAAPPQGEATPDQGDTATPEAIVAPGQPTAAGAALAAEGLEVAGGDQAPGEGAAPGPDAESEAGASVSPAPAPPPADVDPMTAAARMVAEPLLDPIAATLEPDGQEGPGPTAAEAQTEGDARDGGDARAADPTEGRTGSPDAGGESQPAAAAARPVPRSRTPRAGARRADEVPASHIPRFEQLYAGAVERGYVGDRDSLATLYLEALEDAKQIRRELHEFEAEEGQDSFTLLQFISSIGGFGIEREAGGSTYSERTGKLLGSGGMVGELENLLEYLNRNNLVSKKTGKKLPRQFMRSGGLEGAPGIIVRKGGLTADAVLESVNEDPRWEGKWDNLADFLEAVRDAIAVETGVMEAPGSTYELSGILEGALDVRPTSDWWAEQEASLEVLDPTEATLNASGESAASLEAQHRYAGMQARGETFVKYDRFGQRHEVIGVDAVDYVAQPGEAFGIEGPFGFMLLDDAGGKYPNVNVADMAQLEEIDLPEPGEVDLDDSFDISQFEQSGIPLFENDVPGATQKLTDTLSTGEQQPRLPGDVGAVRDQEVQQPTLGEIGFGLEQQAEERTGQQDSLFDMSLTPEQELARRQQQKPRGRRAIEGQDSLFQEAWHGSPHIFERFSLHEIGSGEGAQAYGWGLYFASNREVAEYYRAVLSQQDILLDGKVLPKPPDKFSFPPRPSVEEFPDLTDEQRSVVGYLAWEPNVDAALNTLRYNALLRSHDPTVMKVWEDRREALKTLRDRVTFRPGGRLFRVEVPDNDVLLDWDAIEQSPQVQAGLEQLGLSSELAAVPTADEVRAMYERLEGMRKSERTETELAVIREGFNIAVGPGDDTAARLADWWARSKNILQNRRGITGRQLYQQLTRKVLHEEQAAGTGRTGHTEAARLTSERLASVGIVGLRYLDGMSRGKGEGSHNFVIFDDALIDVLEFFQSPAPAGGTTQQQVDAWVQELRAATGPDLQQVHLKLEANGELAITRLEVQRGAVRSGVATNVLQAIARFADAKRLRLTVAIPDQTVEDGQLARHKLEQFYGRFGFTRKGNRLKREPTIASAFAGMSRDEIEALRPASSDIFETGRPVTFEYQRRTAAAPKPDTDDRFLQNIEPAGRYMLERSTKPAEELADLGVEVGTVTFENPLVIEEGGGYHEADNWKRRLSEQYDGQTGKALSSALLDDGFDAVVTIGKYGVSEIVDLTVVGQRTPPDPSLPTREPLIVTHNLSAANLRTALRLGGLPVPSLAVTKLSNALSGFGEITLIGSKEMADPRGYAKTRVFGADVYSPRYPPIKTIFSEAAQVKLMRMLVKTADRTGDRYIDEDSLADNARRYLTQDINTLMATVLDERGIAWEPVYETLPNGKVQVDRMRTANVLFKAIDDNGLRDAVDAAAQQLIAELQPTEKIYMGYTNAGRRRYIPHTLENVVKIMKKDLRGGEANTNIYGVGQLRAKFTPQFKTVKAIQDAAGRIVSDLDFEAVKQEIEAEFFALVDDLKLYYPHGSDSWRLPDTVMAVLEDGARKPMTGVLREYGFEGVPDEAIAKIRTFLQKLRDMPTEYFEAKILREVDLAEFAGAVVPTSTAADVLEALRARGVRVATYNPDVKGDRGRAVSELAADLDEAVLFQKSDAPRGAIRIGRWPQIDVGLFEGADLSTFLHESGHLWLEAFGDVADAITALAPEQRTESQQRVLADYQTLLDWLGVGSRREIKREQHEQFARGFEAYLFHGVAPSSALREVFIKFRAWLLTIYQSIKGLGVNLTPEVQGVMGRLLATDQAIATAAAEASVKPMFTTAEQAGMSEQEFQLYAETVQRASTAAREKLQQRLLEEVQREHTLEWLAQRDRIEKDVTEEFHGRPVYRAIAAMQRGTNPDGTPLLEGLEEPLPMKLSRQILVERFGAERLKRLPRPYVYTTKGGIDPEIVADTFGFASADEMLTAIENAPPVRAAVKAEVDRRMLAENGSVLLDGTLREQAAAAIATEERAAVVRAEMRALNELRKIARPFVKAGEEALAAEQAERAYERRWLEAEARLRVAIAEKRKQAEIDALRTEVARMRAKARGGAASLRNAIPNDETIRALALERVRAMKVRDLRPYQFWTAATKASRRATEAAARGDIDSAITLKQAELVNLALFRETTRLKDEVDRKVRRVRELANPGPRARIGLAGHTYLDQLDGFLDRYSFAKATQKALDRRQRLIDWVEGLKGEGLPAELPEAVLNDALRMPYQELTVEAFEAVAEGIDAIVHLARLKNRLLKSEQARTFTATKEDLILALESHTAERTPKLEYTPLDEKLRKVADWFASHTKLSFLVRQFDGYQDAGAWWQHIMRPINDAASAESARKAASSRKLLEILERHYPARAVLGLSRKLEIAGVGSLTKEATLAVALNWGNQTSRDRLLNDPVRKWSAAHVTAILDTLDQRDWEFVQDVWDFIDTFWPDIAAKQERVTGLAPEKVPALEVRTKYGAFRGGYYPLKYDGRMVARAEQVQAASEAQLQAGAAYVRTTTRRGHVETRQSNVRLSVKLDLGVMFEHVDQVVHDLTHHEMLIDVTRLLRDREVSAAIISRYGDVTLQQFTRALQDIALGYVPQRNIMDAAAAWMRTGTQIAMLGYNLWTALQQPLGLFNGWATIGGKWVGRGLRRWLRDAASLENTVQWIAEVSPFMAERGLNATQDLSDLRAAFRQPGGWFDNLVRTVTADTLTKQAIVDSFLWHIGFMQRVADVPVWLGQYEKALAGGHDEKTAIALADQAVINSQGSGQIKDLAQVQRGGQVARLFLVFYSYGSITYNQARDAIGRTRWKSPTSIATMLGNLSLIYVWPAVATVALANLVGRDDDEDLEDWLLNIGGEAVASVMNGVVLVRELSALARPESGVRGYAGPAGARLMDLVFKAAGQIKQGEADEALWRAVNNLAGSVLRYPAAQAQRTAEGAAALAEGRSSNPTVLLFGPPREE